MWSLYETLGDAESESDRWLWARRCRYKTNNLRWILERKRTIQGKRKTADLGGRKSTRQAFAVSKDNQEETKPVFDTSTFCSYNYVLHFYHKNKTVSFKKIHFKINNLFRKIKHFICNRLYFISRGKVLQIMALNNKCYYFSLRRFFLNTFFGTGVLLKK